MKRIFIFSAFLILLDQWSKYLALTQLQEEYFIIEPWLSFSLQFNTGIAFSIPLPNWFMMIVVSLVVIFGTHYALRHLDWENIYYRSAFCCIFSGACGNLLDRIWHAQVIDFIKVGWWPVFNIADSLICIGVAIVIFEQLFIARHDS